MLRGSQPARLRPRAPELPASAIAGQIALHAKATTLERKGWPSTSQDLANQQQKQTHSDHLSGRFSWHDPVLQRLMVSPTSLRLLRRSVTSTAGSKQLPCSRSIKRDEAGIDNLYYIKSLAWSNKTPAAARGGLSPPEPYIT